MEDEFISATSTDNQLKLRLNKADLLRLSPELKHALLEDPVKFLLSTQHPLLIIHKRMTRRGLLLHEEFHHDTAANGFCYIIMLLQLFRRDQAKTFSERPPAIDIFHSAQDRQDLIQFIDHLMSHHSGGTAHEDNNRLRTAREHLVQQKNSLDTINYIGIETIDMYHFPFPVTGWTHNGQDQDYLVLAYTNLVGGSHSYVSAHAVTCETYKTITDTPNDFHQNREHFYCVPTQDVWSTRRCRLQQALEAVRQPIQQLLTDSIPPQRTLPQRLLNSSTHSVTLDKQWARLSLNLTTLTDLPAQIVLETLSDPLRFLQESMVPLFHVAFNNSFDPNTTPSSVEWSNLSASPYDHPHLLAVLQSHASTTGVHGAELILHKGLTVLARKLLVLIPQISSNYVMNPTPLAFPLQIIRGMDAHQIIRLEITSNFALFTNCESADAIYTTLCNSITPTMQIAKKLQCELSDLTPGLGHCFPLALHQSWTRDQSFDTTKRVYQNPIPSYLQHMSLTTDRTTYKSWLQQLRTGCNVSSTDLRRHIQSVHDNAHSSTPTSLWFHPSAIQELHLPWRITLWEQSTDMQYSQPSWSNRLSPHHKAPSLPSCYNHSQLLCLLRGSNDIELSNRHYYLLPVTATSHLLISYEHALRNLATNMFNLFQAHRQQQSITRPTSTDIPTVSLTTPTPPTSAFFLPTFRTYNLPSLNSIIISDKYFLQKSSWDVLLTQLKVSVNTTTTCYPSPPIRECLNYLLERTTVKQSTICNEKGLFISGTTIQTGEIIGIYAGPRTLERNSYTMHVTNNFEVGDLPTDSDPWTKYGYINEYIWDRSKCNCVIGEYAIIRATKPLKHGDELFFSYGQQYDWDHLKLQYHYSLVEALVTMSQFLPSPPSAELIRETYLSTLQNVHYSGFKDLLTHFFQHEADHPLIVFPLHDSVPEFEGDVLLWIELVLRCRWFYEQHCFRRFQQPRQQLCSFHPIGISSSSGTEPLRRSIRNKKTVSYIDPSDNISTHGRKKRSSDYCLHSMTAFPVIPRYQYIMSTVPTEQLNPLLQALGEEPQDTAPDRSYDESMDSASRESTSPNVPSRRSPGYSRPPHHDEHVTQLETLADELIPPKNRHFPTPSTVTTMSFNINGPNDMRYREIISIIHEKAVDITTIIDARVASDAVASYKYRLRRQLGSGYVIMVFPTQTNDTSTQLIGGTVIILSKRISKSHAVQLVPLGSLVQLTCQFGSQELSLFSVYMPIHSREMGSLNARIASLLQIPHNRVHQHIHKTLQDAVVTMQSKSIPVIVTGDFNHNLRLSADRGEYAYLFNHLLLEHAASDQELLQPSYERGALGSDHRVETRIDFTLYNGTLRPNKCTCISYSTFENDHMPVLTTFEIPGQSIPFEQIMTKPGIVKYDYKDPQLREEFEALTYTINTHPEAPASERLRLITEQTVERAASLRPVRGATRGLKPNLWSPENCALEVTLKALVLINRHVHGYKKYTKWTDKTYGKKLKKIREQWRSNIVCKGETAEMKKQLLLLTEYGPQFWENLTRAQVEEHLLVATPAVRKLLSTKLKQQRRDEYKAFCVKRDFHFQLQQIGGPIQSVLRKQKLHYAMEDLIIDDKTTSLPGVIAGAITKSFRDEWFNSPPGANDIAWATHLNDEKSFIELATTLGIQPFEAQLLWKAVEQRPTNSTKLSEFQREVVRIPTIEEYMQQINLASIDSAGGMSGLTYAMMKSWPQHVHEEVYNALVENWTAKEIPNDWKWRWLLPIPKAPNPSLTQLRPLCLLEVLRKLWSKIFIQRITNYVQQEKILHAGQHSGKGKGTDSAVLEFVATLETAKELKSQLFISSWDLRRAFDSVDRRLLLFSWVRIGVPFELAIYLVNMDMEAVMVVQTPLAMVVHNERGKEGLDDCNLSFHPERGTAQGGVDSSLIFAAFIDILLRAIELVSEPAHMFYISDIDGNLQAATSIGYVDDLVCASGTSDGLQTIANLVSAFCILFHLELNSTKFRAFALNWGNPNIPAMDTMTIYTKGWIPTTITMQHDGTMTHLGVDWDMFLDNTTMYEKIVREVTITLDRVVKSTASQAIRIAAIQISLMNQLVYETKFTTWSLQDYQKIDVLFNKALRCISLNQKSFPTSLLYMSTEQLGLGYPQFSTQCQIAKLHLYQRSAYSTDTRRQFIINSLTARVIRQMRCQPCRHGPYILSLLDTKLLPVEERGSWWFSSLAQHMAQTGISLERDTIATLPLPLHLPLDIKSDRLRIASLVANGISLPQELHMDGDTAPQLQQLSITWSRDMAVPITALPLRQGQVWVRYDQISHTYTISEIMGFLGDESIVYLPWQIVDYGADSHPRRISLLNGTAAMRGAGSIYHSTTEILFPDSYNYTYYITNLDVEHYEQDTNTSTCKALRERQPVIPCLKMIRYDTNNEWFRHITSEISTHVRTTSPNTLINRLMSQKRIDATSILIKTDHSTTPWTQHALHIEHTQSSQLSRTSAHVFALYVAASQSTQIRQTFTSTDKCGQTLHRKSANKPVADSLAAILQPNKAHRMFPLPPLTEDQSSILKTLRRSPNNALVLSNEQLQEANLQTQIFSTRVLSLTQQQLTRHHPGSTVTHTTDIEFLLPLRMNYNGMLCDSVTQLPNLECYSIRHQRQLAATYLERRDQYRRQVHDDLNKVNPTPHYWSASSTSLAVDVISKVPRGSMRSMVMRILRDWHLTGYNKLKRSLDPTDAICPLCDAAIEDQQHILCHCTHVHMRSTRTTHMNMINKKLQALPPTSFSTKLIKAYHSHAIKPCHYELLLGRMHPHHEAAILSLPVAKSGDQANATYSLLVAHCRQYISMAIALYQTRQQIISLKEKDPTSNGIIPGFNPERQRVLSNETLIGIGTHHFLAPDGTKVVKRLDPSITITISNKRTSLDSTNSVIIRRENDLFDKRQRIEDARAQKQHDQHNLKLITHVDRSEWNTKHPEINIINENLVVTAIPLAIPAIPIIPIVDTSIPNDDITEQSLFHHQSNKLQQLLGNTNSIFPEFPTWCPQQPVKPIEQTVNDIANTGICASPNPICPSSVNSNIMSHSTNNISEETINIHEKRPHQLDSTVEHSSLLNHNNNDNCNCNTNSNCDTTDNNFSENNNSNTTLIYTQPMQTDHNNHTDNSNNISNCDHNNNTNNISNKAAITNLSSSSNPAIESARHDVSISQQKLFSQDSSSTVSSHYQSLRTTSKKINTRAKSVKSKPSQLKFQSLSLTNDPRTQTQQVSSRGIQCNTNNNVPRSITHYFTVLPSSPPPSIIISTPENSNTDRGATQTSVHQDLPQPEPPLHYGVYPDLAVQTPRGSVTRCSPGTPGGPSGQG